MARLLRLAIVAGVAYAAYTIFKRTRTGASAPSPMGADAAPAPVVPGSSTAPETVMPDGAEFNARIGARTIGSD